MIVHSPNEPIMVPVHLVNDTKLSMSAKFLWVVLWANQDDVLDFGKLAKIIRRSPKTTRKYFKELVDAGYIVQNEKGYEISFDEK